MTATNNARTAKGRTNNAKAVKAAALETALLNLRNAAKLETKAAGDKAKAQTGADNARKLTIAGMSNYDVWLLKFDVDVLNRKGEVIEHKAGLTLADYAKGFKNAEGKAYRALETAFRERVLASFFNAPANADSVWTMFRQVYPIGQALLLEGVKATVEGDTLKLEGGTGDSAKALRDAAEKSVTALGAAAKARMGIEGKKRQPKPGEGESNQATLTDVLTIVRDFLQAAVTVDGETDIAPTETDDRLIAEIAKLATTYAKNI